MEFFRIRRDIPFMRHALAFNVVSLLTFLAAVFFLATRGLHFSIEFTGGTVIEVGYAQTADVGKVRRVVEGLNFGEVQVGDDGRDGELPLEAKRQVQHDADDDEGERLRAVFGQLAPDLRADELAAA